MRYPQKNLNRAESFPSVNWGEAQLFPPMAAAPRKNELAYYNAATCPACSESMLRQGGERGEGGSYVCPDCGLESYLT